MIAALPKGHSIAALGCILLLAAPAAALFPAPEPSTTPISIVFPGEGGVLGTSERAWLIGSVFDPEGRLTINGTIVTVHKGGGFIALLPVSQGTFTFTALLQSGATSYGLERQVLITPAPAPLPEKPTALDSDSLAPRQDEELRAGDWLLTRAKASPGCKVEYRLGRKGAWQPMRELVPALGIHEGAYLVRADEEISSEQVEFRAHGARGHAQARSPGKVTITRAAPLVASLRGQNSVMVRTGPGEGDLFPALGGMRFLIVGRKGNEAKIQLSGGQTGWIDANKLEFMLPGAHPPRAETDTVAVRPGERETIIRVGLGERVPFIVESSEDMSTLTVRLHYTYLHTNWIVYNEADDFVDEVRLRQETSDIVVLTVRLKPGRKLWGYWPSYEGNALKLELRKPPRLPKRGSPLAGLRVFLDPGHMPSAPGATGPLGTKEMDVNFALAQETELLLKKEGAFPILSRSSPADEVSLSDRPRLAMERKADAFVSIHNNFLSPAANPFKGNPHGFSIFYYHPHSLDLARLVAAAYGKNLPLPSEELRFGNLLVCRLPAMPAILTETAYLTYPEQEAMLLDQGFRRKAAASIVEGLRAFFLRERERQHK